MIQDIPAAARRAVEWQLCRPGELLACDVVRRSIAALGLPEEECALEIFGALSAMIRAGRVYCSTMSSGRREIRFTGDTMLSPVAMVVQ